LSGLTAGTTYYLSDSWISNSYSSVNSGQLVQELGTTNSATNLHVNIKAILEHRKCQSIKVLIIGTNGRLEEAIIDMLFKLYACLSADKRLLRLRFQSHVWTFCFPVVYRFKLHGSLSVSFNNLQE
jgi:hypothetical protein